MKKTIQGLFLVGISLLFTQASLATDGGRTELEGPGDAEVIAGTGYQHTLTCLLTEISASPCR